MRQQLMCLRQEQQRQERQWASFQQQRQELCQHLHSMAQWRGKLNPRQAEEQRALQHKVYQAERQAYQALRELTAKRQQQQDAITSQQALLRTNQREQEKLRMLIKDESSRY